MSISPQTTEAPLSTTEFRDDRVLDKTLLVRGYEVVIGFETHAQLSTHSKKIGRAHV